MADEEKTVTLKLYQGSVPRLLITYKDKDELYEKFMRKIKRLNYPIGEIRSSDCEGEHIVIKNADDLFAAVDNSYNVKVYVRPAEEADVFSCPSSGEDEEEPKKEEVPKKIEKRNRSRSPAHGRGRSRSEPRHGSRHHGGHSHHRMPWNYGPWIDPRFGVDTHHHDKSKDKCHCKDLCADFEKL